MNHTKTFSLLRHSAAALEANHLEANLEVVEAEGRVEFFVTTVEYDHLGVPAPHEHYFSLSREKTVNLVRHLLEITGVNPNDLW